MSLRRVLHPWFDDPEVLDLREFCIAQGADYISHERGETRRLEGGGSPIY